MSEELETSVRTQDGGRLSLSEWDEGAVWLHLSFRGGTSHTIIDREEAQQLLAGLQAILAKEVVA
jgi:hypothetical protein